MLALAPVPHHIHPGFLLLETFLLTQHSTSLIDNFVPIGDLSLDWNPGMVHLELLDQKAAGIPYIKLGAPGTSA